MVGCLAASIDLKELNASLAQRIPRDEVFGFPAFTERNGGRMLERYKPSGPFFTRLQPLTKLQLKRKRLTVGNLGQAH